jgi:hypothetical protein
MDAFFKRPWTARFLKGRDVMRNHRGLAVAVASMVLLVSPGCNLETFDANGDGIVSRGEMIDGVIGWLCGDDQGTGEEPIGEQPTDGPTPEERIGEGTSAL